MNGTKSMKKLENYKEKKKFDQFCVRSLFTGQEGGNQGDHPFILVDIRLELQDIGSYTYYVNTLIE